MKCNQGRPNDSAAHGQAGLLDKVLHVEVLGRRAADLEGE
jgi:hypothetical protein